MLYRHKVNGIANAIVKTVTGQGASAIIPQVLTPNTIIAPIEKLCNTLGVRDNNSNILAVDGISGPLTVEGIITYILFNCFVVLEGFYCPLLNHI
ncbi:MAG: hypothetical protein ABF633_19275 [Clostridium sp.]|uniref:hypothetical protein n=1 Tax=Clostridium sp. TaxID=1506 RepID=UPI0039EAED7A